MKTGTIIVVVVALLAIIGLLFFFVAGNDGENGMPVDRGQDTGNGAVNGESADGETGDGSGTIPVGYRTYRSADLNFSMLIPASATVSQVGASRVEFTFLGPGNEPNTEITDGFTATVFREETGATTVRAYADEVLADTRSGSENTITSGLEARTVNGMAAYRFSYRGALGNEITTYTFLDEGFGYQVTYSVSDPNGRGYESVVFTMLESIQFSSQSADGGRVSSVQLALLDYDGVGQESDGPTRGCDRVVMVEEQIQPTAAPLSAALSRLFAIDSQEYRGWNHFIAQTNDTLSFVRASVEDGTASIYLSGELSGLSGVCDNPRARIQIEETALQFATVDDVQIYLNGERTDLQPSGRGE